MKKELHRIGGAFIAVTLVLVGLTLMYKIYTPSSQKDRAKTSMASYLQALNIDYGQSTCNKDSDGDGYASCSYNNKGRVVNLECDSAFVFNTMSCKAPKHLYSK